jgi:hypothetical protein
MFYFFAGLIIGGYVVYAGFTRVKCSTLTGLCPFSIIVPGVTALILYLEGEEFIATMVLVFGIAISTLMMMAIRKLVTSQDEKNPVEAKQKP